MLPSCPNKLSIPVKHAAVNTLQFFPGNCGNLAANVAKFFRSVEIGFIPFIF
jgi:hypothetical protein